MVSALRFIRSKRAVLVSALALVLTLVVIVGDEPDQAYAGQWWNAGDTHWFWIADTSELAFYSGLVESSAATYGENNGSVLKMTAHKNTANVLNGRCGYNYYPFCWWPATGPKIRYYHSSNSYTLNSGWRETTRDECLFRRDDHGTCFDNSKLLAWATFPVTAAGSRNVPLQPGKKGSDRYTYTHPCCGPSVSFHTRTYTVQ